MTYEDELIARARELQALLTKRRRLKRNLRVVDNDIRTVKRMVKAIKHASEGQRPQTAPNRLDNGVTGHRWPTKDKR